MMRFDKLGMAVLDQSICQKYSIYTDIFSKGLGVFRSHLVLPKRCESGVEVFLKYY